MPQFFVETLSGDTVLITGEDARHIARSLRCRVGEELTLCDGAGTVCRCAITGICADRVELAVLERGVSKAEPPVFVTLYQALPKADKLEWIVQKATELGVGAMVPVQTRFCVSRPDERAMEKRLERLHKIALEAAKQSGRGRIPAVLPPVSFVEAVSRMAADRGAVFFYEKAAQTLGRTLADRPESISIMVGPEGGFSQEEAAAAQEAGIPLCTMGPRILRCETAPLYALSAIMYTYENSVPD